MQNPDISSKSSYQILKIRVCVHNVSCSEVPATCRHARFDARTFQYSRWDVLSAILSTGVGCEVPELPL